jgi:conserved oligomeric Golgi complex subunit 7
MTLASAHVQVALGAAEEYLRQLEAIPRLSAAGGAQAAADAEYFCNVLSALGVALPPQLGTWQVGR